MKTIQSRIAPNGYLGIVVMSSLMLGLLVMVVSFIVDELAEGKPLDPIMVLVAVIVVALEIFIVVSLSKNYQKFVISDKGITVKSESYRWSDICEVESTGKYPWANSYTEAIKIVLNNSRRVFIPIDTFSNHAEICQAIEHIKLQIKGGEQPSLSSFIYEPQSQVKHYVEDRKLVKYGKSHILSVNGLMFVFFVWVAFKCASLFVKFYATSSFSYLFSVGYFVPMTLMVAGAMVVGMFYFELSDTHLVVRNPLLPLYKRGYPLSDILATDSEIHFRVPKGLRVVTRQYDSTLFHASTLSSTEWQEMFTDLRRRGVDTRGN